MPVQAIFVAFGKVSRPKQALASEGPELARGGQAIGRQVALLGPDSPALRLNTPGWLRTTPEMISALSDRSGLRLLCRDRLEAITPIFAARARQWIDMYFDEAAAVMGSEDIAGRTLSFPSDRFFSIPLPLPMARVARGAVTSGKIDLPEESEFAALDLAVWDGSRLIGVVFGDESATTPGQRSRLARLSGDGGPTFELRYVSSRQEGTDLARALIEPVLSVPPPFYGPYRADGFRAELPAE